MMVGPFEGHHADNGLIYLTENGYRHPVVFEDLLEDLERAQGAHRSPAEVDQINHRSITQRSRMVH